MPGFRHFSQNGDGISSKISQHKGIYSEFSEPEDPAHDLSKPTDRVREQWVEAYATEHKHLGTLSHELHDYGDNSLTHAICTNPGGDRPIIVQSDDEHPEDPRKSESTPEGRSMMIRYNAKRKRTGGK